MNNLIQILTYFRIIAGPMIFCLILVFQSYGIALSILLLASASDYWDGYLARKYSLTSVLGAVLDPIADKILITFVLIALGLALDSIFIAFLGRMMSFSYLKKQYEPEFIFQSESYFSLKAFVKKMFS